MSYRTVRLKKFIRTLKPLIKKYFSLEGDVVKLETELCDNYKKGKYIRKTKHCYKVRLKTKAKKTGKSGAFRVIYHVKNEIKIIFMVIIYDKSKYPDISHTLINEIVKCIDCGNFTCKNTKPFN